MLYNQYLQTTHWQEKRAEKLKRCSHCQICNSKTKLHIHHKKYTWNEKERAVRLGIKKAGSTLFNEELHDLLTLCSSCHRFWHYYFKKAYPRHKTLNRIRRLLRLGIDKKMVFYLSSNPQILNSVIPHIIKMQD